MKASSLPIRRDRTELSTSSPLLTSTLFAFALLAFLLPFATVSCGAAVTFTGVELATGRVAEDAPLVSDEREFAGEVEANGTALALAALVAVALGLALAIAQVRGVGVAALAALLALLLLPWSAAAALADFQVHEGYVLAAAATAGVVGERRLAAVRRRRTEGRRRWPAVLAAFPLVVAVGVTAALCIDSARYV